MKISILRYRITGCSTFTSTLLILITNVYSHRHFLFSQDAPVFASKPHFLDADPDYLKNVTGLHPNRSIHDSYLVIEPVRTAR